MLEVHELTELRVRGFVAAGQVTIVKAASEGGRGPAQSRDGQRDHRAGAEKRGGWDGISVLP